MPKTSLKITASQKRLRISERAATLGLLLICAALVAPFFNPQEVAMLAVYRWIYAAGALLYVGARVAGVNVEGDSLRLKRLRRMEFWAGMAFVAGAAFWFYTQAHLGPYAGVLAVLNNTIMFTLAGAVIQIVASWLIVAQTSKDKEKEGK